MISWFPSLRLGVPTAYFTPPLSSFLFSCSTNSSYLSSLFKIFPCSSMSPYFFKIFYSVRYTQPLPVIYCTFLIPVISNSNFYIPNKPLTLVFYCPSSSIDPKSIRDPSTCLQSGREDFSISLPFIPRRNQSIVSSKVNARRVL